MGEYIFKKEYTPGSGYKIFMYVRKTTVFSVAEIGLEYADKN